MVRKRGKGRRGGRVRKDVDTSFTFEDELDKGSSAASSSTSSAATPSKRQLQSCHYVASNQQLNVECSSSDPGDDPPAIHHKKFRAEESSSVDSTAVEDNVNVLLCDPGKVMILDNDNIHEIKSDERNGNCIYITKNTIQSSKPKSYNCHGTLEKNIRQNVENFYEAKESTNTIFESKGDRTVDRTAANKNEVIPTVIKMSTSTDDFHGFCSGSKIGDSSAVTDRTKKFTLQSCSSIQERKISGIDCSQELGNTKSVGSEYATDSSGKTKCITHIGDPLGNSSHTACKSSVSVSSDGNAVTLILPQFQHCSQPALDAPSSNSKSEAVLPDLSTKMEEATIHGKEHIQSVKLPHTTMKKISRKFGDEFILVSVEKNTQPQHGKHECVLCLPGDFFQPKQLAGHMKSLLHLINVLELTDFGNYIKHKTCNDPVEITNLLTKLLSSEAPKKVLVVRSNVADDTRNKLKQAIVEKRQKSRNAYLLSSAVSVTQSSAKPIPVGSFTQSSIAAAKPLPISESVESLNCPVRTTAPNLQPSAKTSNNECVPLNTTPGNVVWSAVNSTILSAETINLLDPATSSASLKPPTSANSTTTQSATFITESLDLLTPLKSTAAASQAVLSSKNNTTLTVPSISTVSSQVCSTNYSALNKQHSYNNVTDKYKVSNCKSLADKSGKEHPDRFEVLSDNFVKPCYSVSEDVSIDSELNTTKSLSKNLTESSTALPEVYKENDIKQTFVEIAETLKQFEEVITSSGDFNDIHEPLEVSDFSSSETCKSVIESVTAQTSKQVSLLNIESEAEQLSEVDSILQSKAILNKTNKSSVQEETLHYKAAHGGVAQADDNGDNCKYVSGSGRMATFLPLSLLSRLGASPQKKENHIQKTEEVLAANCEVEDMVLVNTDDDELPVEVQEDNKVIPVPKCLNISSEIFEHVIILGDYDQLKSSHQWNSDRITFFDFDNSSLKYSFEQLPPLRSSLPERTLWIFLGDLNIFTERVPFNESLCMKASCTQLADSLPDYQLAVRELKSDKHFTNYPFMDNNERKTMTTVLVNVRFQQFLDALNPFQESLSSTARVLLAPLLPRRILYTKNIVSHQDVHNVFNEYPDLIFTEDHPASIASAATYYDKKIIDASVNFNAPKLCTTLIRDKFKAGQKCAINVCQTIKTASKSITRINDWFDILKKIINESVGISQLKSNDVTKSGCQYDKYVKNRTSVNNFSANKLENSVATSSAIMPDSVYCSVFKGSSAIDNLLLNLDQKPLSAANVDVKLVPHGKPLFPSAEVLLKMPPPCVVPVTSSQSKLTSGIYQEQLKICNTTGGKILNADSTKMSLSDFPFVDNSTDYQVYISNIPVDLGSFFGQVLKACGKLISYRIKSEEDGTSSVASAVFKEHESAQNALRVLNALTVNKRKLQAFSTNAKLKESYWTSNQLITKFKIKKRLLAAGKTFTWDHVEERNSENLDHKDQSHGSNRRSSSPIRKSKNSVKSHSWYVSDSYSSRRRSSVKRRSRSPIRHRKRSTSRRYSRSPAKHQSRSPIMRRSRSPLLRRTRSPLLRRTRSPLLRRTRSPICRTKSPLLHRNGSPLQPRRRSLMLRRSNTPIMHRSSSPLLHRSRSPMQPWRSHVRNRSKSRDRSPSNLMSKFSPSRAPSPAVVHRSRSPIPRKSLTRVRNLKDVFLQIPHRSSCVLLWSSKNLSTAFVMDIHRAFNGTVIPALKPHIGWLFQLGSPEQAALFQHVMNGIRLLDAVITTQHLDPHDDFEHSINKEELYHYHNLVDKCCSNYDKSITVLLSENLNKCVDMYTYKVYPCPIPKCPRQNCHYYHNDSERRRDINKFFYRVVLCFSLNLHNNPCPKGVEKCNFAHSYNEAQLHPMVFLRKLCNDYDAPARRCKKEQLCTCYHTGTPDQLYHNSWQDLYVTGLENSFYFAAGAVRNLFKKKKENSEFRRQSPLVMFVSPCLEVARRVHAMLAPLTDRQKLLLGPLNSLKGHVIVGVVSSLLKEMCTLRPVMSQLCALVLDDIAGLLSPGYKRDTTTLIWRLFRDELKPADVHKVVVDAEVDEEVMLQADKLLRTSMRMISSDDDKDANSKPEDTALPYQRERPHAAVPTVEISMAERYIQEKSAILERLNTKYRRYYVNPELHPRSRDIFVQVAAEGGGDGKGFIERWKKELERMRSDQYQELMMELVNKYRPKNANSTECSVGRRGASGRAVVRAYSPPRSSEGNMAPSLEAIPSLDNHYKEASDSETSSSALNSDTNQRPSWPYLVSPNRDLSSASSNAKRAMPILDKASVSTSDYHQVNTQQQQDNKLNGSMWETQNTATNRDFHTAKSVTNTDSCVQSMMDLHNKTSHFQNSNAFASLDTAFPKSSSSNIEKHFDQSDWLPDHNSAESDTSSFPACSSVFRTRPNVGSTKNSFFSQSVMVPTGTFNQFQQTSRPPVGAGTLSSAPSDNPASPLRSPSPTCIDDPELTSVDCNEVLYTLEVLSPSLDVLTPALNAMIAVARQRGPNTLECYKLFSDPEIINLLSLCVHNFKRQMATTKSSSTFSQLQKGVALAERLMEYSQRLVGQ